MYFHNFWKSASLILASLILCAFPLFSSPQKNSIHGVLEFAQSAQIPGATRVGSKVCETCHSSLAGNFTHSFHSQQGVECEDCHGGGSLHVQSGGNVKKIIVFNKLSSQQANAVCLSCHEQSTKIRNWPGGPHASNGVRCTDCHQIHSSAKPSGRARTLGFETMETGHAGAVENMVPEAKMVFESREETNDNCLRCHQEQRAQMNLPYHHPLREAKMTCVDCHDPHGGVAENNLRGPSVNQLCLGCHSQYRGPFTYQHPPVTESCLICHTPHGSPNTNLLRVSEPALCLQCHTGHHNGANLPLMDRCTDCHGSIHGSDVPTASGGSRFVDKGPNGVPSEPTGAAPAGAFARAHAAAIAAPAVATGGVGMSLVQFMQQQQAGGVVTSHAGPAGSPNVFSALSVTPAQYREIGITGYGGRVGEYDSLDNSAGGAMESAYVSLSHGLTILTRASILAGSDYHVTSQWSMAKLLDAAIDLRSFVQHQDNYAFYSNVISPDITTSETIPRGAIFGVTRRIGNAHVRVKLPNLPIHLFVRGNWQARAGTTQAAWLDESNPSSDPTACTLCHFSSQFQALDQTTRTITGGAEAKLGQVDVTWEHTFSSFNDRLPFPTAYFGGFYTPNEPVPVDVPSTPPGYYYFDIPAPNQDSTDTVRLNWTPSPQVIFNGNVSYTRARDIFTQHPQNIFNAAETLNWHPIDRLRMTFDYRQQNLINNFVPYFALYGDVSYHEHWAGLRLEYELRRDLDLEARYERNGITRSNSFLWPQIYDIDNTDPQHVIPSTSANTVGLGLRYHRQKWWNARAGYAWTGTHDPGFVVVPKSNNRIYADATLLPTSWLIFTSDTDLIIQNAFPAVPLPNTPGDFQRRNRFYNETADASLIFQPNWNLDFGYSYQQNLLNTYMGLQNDNTVGYVLDEPFVPYNQLNQTYWVKLGSRFLSDRLNWNARVTYDSARSGMTPDLNPNDAALLGNAGLIQQGLFDPVAFGQALGALQLGSTLVSQVIVPEWIGQSKVYYLLPHGFNTGFLFSYGSYKDYLNPNLNGVLRAYTLYVGRSW